MLGLDTNILLRYVLDDDAVQSPVAVRIVETECTPNQPGFINHVVLCELVWTLASGYRQPRAKISELIAGLLRIDRLAVEEPQEVAAAIVAFQAGADFSDALVAIRNQRLGCSTTLTFDRKVARLSPMQLAN